MRRMILPLLYVSNFSARSAHTETDPADYALAGHRFAMAVRRSWSADLGALVPLAGYAGAAGCPAWPALVVGAFTLLVLTG